MSSESNLNRESFQQFLASAYAVQESQIDSQFLSAIVEVQRLITKGELGVAGAMSLVVDSAREVAGAAGVAIGLLEGDQLIYRAGSGCSAESIGNRVAASLTVSSHTKAKLEILRVENAAADTRIEAAICRQFGAESLLILPIYRERAVAGVLEILFSEAHPFQEGEVSTYRLMAGLIETALLRVIEPEQKKPPARQLLPRLPSLQREEPRDDWEMVHPQKRSVSQRWGSALFTIRQLPALQQPGLTAKAMMQRARALSSQMRHWNVAFAAMAAFLGLALWMATGGRGPASVPGSTDPQKSNAIDGPLGPENAPAGDSILEPADQSTGPVLKTAKLTGGTVRRIRMGRNEVDYIGDDVTVRHFIDKPTPTRRARGASRITYIGKDVTVRHFTPPSEANGSR